VSSCQPVKGESFGVLNSEAVGLQAGGPGPWLGGSGQNSAVLSRRLGECSP
jgi:hypothetical protein